MLIYVSFGGHEDFLITSFSGISVPSLNEPVFSARGFSLINWFAFWKQSNIAFFVCASSTRFFWQTETKKIFVHFWKPIIPFSVCLPMLTVFWCSFPFNAKLLLEQKRKQSMHLPVRGTASAGDGSVILFCEEKENLNFCCNIQVLDLMLKRCSDTKEGNWMHFFFYKT